MIILFFFNMSFEEVDNLAHIFKENLKLETINENENENENEYLIKKLKNILEENKINHFEEIKKCIDLKKAHIYCKINKINGQETGSLIENYIKYKYKLTKNKSSLCIGDLSIKNKNYEIKVSNGGKKNNQFNYVQIRMNHQCEYILTSYYLDKNNINDLGELFIFKLSKDNMKNLLKKYGHYAHGTKKNLGPITIEDLDNETNIKEYALRPKYNDKCFNELLLFRSNEISI